MLAPFGVELTIKIPVCVRILMIGSSAGLSVITISRFSRWYPSWFKATLWRPGMTFNMHGVLHETAGLPSSTAVAPGGSLVTNTVCGSLGALFFDAVRLAGFSRGVWSRLSAGCSGAFFSTSGGGAVSGGRVSAGFVSTGLVWLGAVSGSVLAATGADSIGLGFLS